jgi:hypothetical protein
MSRRDIRMEDISNEEVHPLGTTTHEECIMKEKGRMLETHILEYIKIPPLCKSMKKWRELCFFS